MADLNPMVPGDVPYPQYSVVTPIGLEVGNTFVKGELYTVNTDGLLHTAGADFTSGLLQAMADVPVAAVAGDELQVLGPRTRMILTTTEVGLHVGDDVDGALGSTNVITAVPASGDFIGKIFEIYTKNTDATKKLVTESGDRVVIETVGP